MVPGTKGNFFKLFSGFHMSKRDGKGIVDYDSGVFNDGVWKEDKFLEGNGRMFLVGGKKYEGEIKDGKMNGEGTLTYEDGRYFKGNFSEGKK